MSEFDDFEDGGEGDGEPIALEAGAEPIAAACLSCGAPTIGVFCTNCGQKNDDLRRSIFLLARDFVEDTFSFDSRMWRTLGLLAAAPGAVPKNYAHGRRSRHTPPVRLFLVVSFLFFLLLSFTQTLFVAIEITELDQASAAGVTFLANEDDDDEPALEVDGKEIDCNMQASLRFFVRASEITNDQDRWSACMADVSAAVKADLGNAQTDVDDNEKLTVEEAALFDKLVARVSEAIENPKVFNSAFNNWLPRIMFLMTPIMALILGIFIRGRDALFFDHMVLSLYHHAVGFAIVGVAVAATQLGAPGMGIVAAIALFVYFVAALKAAYGRGWVKTIYSALITSLIYQLILLIIVITITTTFFLRT